MLRKPFLNWKSEQITKSWAPLQTWYNEEPAGICLGAWCWEAAGGGGGVQSSLQTAQRRRDKLHTERYRGISPLGRQYPDRNRQARWQSSEHYTETICHDRKAGRIRLFFFSLYNFRANTAGRNSSGLGRVPWKHMLTVSNNSRSTTPPLTMRTIFDPFPFSISHRHRN